MFDVHNSHAINDLDRIAWGQRMNAIRNTVATLMVGGFLGAMIHSGIWPTGHTVAQRVVMALAVMLVCGALGWFSLLADAIRDDRRRRERHRDVDELAKESRAGFTVGSPANREAMRRHSTWN